MKTKCDCGGEIIRKVTSTATERYDFVVQIWKRKPRTKAEFHRIDYICGGCCAACVPCDRCGDLFRILNENAYTDTHGTALCPECVKVMEKEDGK